ncbi:DnaT-like ssDNA-binding protein [Cronobacter turicensis]|uniref:DnaT-like ssDNA-binding protein n=1 Tax=Cronobacter turicensis TaxID=413502 RepID=UPI000CFB6EB7|nr:DnaT-like ssDNA-binding protein [Cronobacter turicensis]
MINTDITSPDFNSYANEADLMVFAEARDIALPEKTAPLLIRAMDYLEGLSWYGHRASATQPLSWPRAGVYVDGYELPDDEIPRAVINAQCMLAVEAIEGDLLASVREAPVKSESVSGAVSTTYAIPDGGIFTPSYPAVMVVLGDLVGGRGFAINTTAERA